MKTKKIADIPAVVSDGAVTAAAPKKARAPRATTHKHKKAQTAAFEASPVEALQTELQGPTHEQIAVRAYLLAEARGFSGGSPADDWFQAEQQLREELQGRA